MAARQKSWGAFKPWAALLLAPLAALSILAPAQADAIDDLRAFVREAQTGQAEFTQTVMSPDGKKRRVSSGTFEFVRPNRFRFNYLRPFEQTILADGQRLWMHDPDLNQVISRPQTAALLATPAALLAGAGLEREFRLSLEPSSQGVDWVRANPRQEQSGFRSLRIGFRAGVLAVVEIEDAMDQRSVLEFRSVRLNLPLPPQRLTFTVPRGADLIEQR